MYVHPILPHTAAQQQQQQQQQHEQQMTVKQRPPGSSEGPKGSKQEGEETLEGDGDRLARYEQYYITTLEETEEGTCCCFVLCVLCFFSAL